MLSLSACTLPALVCCLYGMCHVINSRVFFFVLYVYEYLHYQASVCIIKLQVFALSLMNVWLCLHRSFV